MEIIILKKGQLPISIKCLRKNTYPRNLNFAAGYFERIEY